LNRARKVDLWDVVNKSWQNVRYLSGKKKINFVNMLKEKELIVVSDEKALTHIVQNLLQNSIKFVPEDQGEIKVIWQDKGDEWWIGVQDNGPGIPKDEQDRVFERFYQVKGQSAKGIKGTGLGLSICKNLIYNLGGKIWVESPIQGKKYGCIIWFSLPKK